MRLKTHCLYVINSVMTTRFNTEQLSNNGPFPVGEIPVTHAPHSSHMAILTFPPLLPFLSRRIALSRDKLNYRDFECFTS